MTTSPSSTSPPPSRFAGLDGLRAFAVLAVIFYHLSPGYGIGGYLGVDIFFVISGFLITALLLREHAANGRIALGKFWVRRARRLLPAIGVLVLACCSVALLIGGDVLVNLGRQVLGAATFSSNWLAIAGGSSYFDETSPELFRNLWSLAVEEQFYLIWPLLVLGLLLVPNRPVRPAAVAILTVASAIGMSALFLPGDDATRVYFGTDTHSFGLTIGALLALVWQALPSPDALRRPVRIGLPILGLGAIGGLVALAALMPSDDPLAYQGGLVVVSVLSAVAIAGGITPGSLLGRLLDVQPLKWIGERSYGLYLWHWPVFVLLLAAYPSWPRFGASGWALGGIALAITVVAAALSHRFIEQPIRQRGFRAVVRGWGHAVRVPGWRPVAIVAAGALVLTGGAASVAAIAADPGRSDAQARIEAGILAVTPKPRPVAPTEPQVFAAPAELPGGEQITAIGDSVMLASAPELQNAFPGIHIDAAVSRQLSAAPAIISALKDAGQLRPVVLLGLGTNGPVDNEVLDTVLDLLGADHQLVLVTAQAPRGWIPDVNSTLALYAQRYRDVELANWHGAIANQLNLLAGDQVHPGQRGGEVYAAAVRDALQRLAELPPLLDPNEFGLAPTPL